MMDGTNIMKLSIDDSFLYKLDCLNFLLLVVKGEEGNRLFFVAVFL